jgi:hypothetical protein
VSRFSDIQGKVLLFEKLQFDSSVFMEKFTRKFNSSIENFYSTELRKQLAEKVKDNNSKDKVHWRNGYRITAGEKLLEELKALMQVGINDVASKYLKKFKKLIKRLLKKEFDEDEYLALFTGQFE